MAKDTTKGIFKELVLFCIFTMLPPGTFLAITWFFVTPIHLTPDPVESVTLYLSHHINTAHSIISLETEYGVAEATSKAYFMLYKLITDFSNYSLEENKDDVTRIYSDIDQWIDQYYVYDIY